MKRKGSPTTNTGSPPGSSAAAQAHSQSGSEWWENFFDENWRKLGFDPISDEQTAKEVDFLVDALGLEPDERVLDLACGVGRHSLALARRGFKHVTGLDFTRAYLKKAILRAKHERLTVNFVHGDMRDIPFEEYFDAVFNFYTSFGYFEKEEDNERTVASIARALRPGGRFLLDVVHRDFIVRHFERRGWSEYNGEYVLEDRGFDLGTSRNNCIWIYLTNKGKTEKRINLRMYSLHELRAMFKRNGLEFKEAWGTWDFQPLTWEHFRQKLLAVKEK